MEATSVNVITDTGPITFLAIYNPPSKRILDQDLDIIIKNNVPKIAAGDFNAKNDTWFSTTINKNGTILYNHCIKNNYTVIAPDEPTYYPYRADGRPDVLDICLLQNINTNISLKVIHELSSDHEPVELNLKTDIQQTNKLTYNFRNICWEKYQFLTLNNAPKNYNLNSPKDIEDVIERQTTAIINSEKSSITATKPPLDIFSTS